MLSELVLWGAMHQHNPLHDVLPPSGNKRPPTPPSTAADVNTAELCARPGHRPESRPPLLRMPNAH